MCGCLQAGIPLVMYLRGEQAEMVELPENSCHAFITYGSVHSPLPCLKVCCCTASMARPHSCRVGILLRHLRALLQPHL